MKPTRWPRFRRFLIKAQDFPVDSAQIELCLEFGIREILQCGPVEPEQAEREVGIDIDDRDFIRAAPLLSR